MRNGPLPAAVTAPSNHEGYNNYAQEFITTHAEQILAHLDGPQGFFAQARESGLVTQLRPEMGRIIDGASRAGLATLGVTGEELKLIVASFRGGQKCSSLQRLNVPVEATVRGDVIDTTFGPMPISRRADTGEPVVPNGRFERNTGTQWLIPTRLAEQYPDPRARRVASLWGFTHEFTHTVLGYAVQNMLEGRPGRPIQLRDGTLTDTTTYLRTAVDHHFPDRPLTQYSGSFAAPDGSLPTGNPVRLLKRIDEEICETAASILGFAPTPNAPLDVTLGDPLAGREQWRQDVTRLLQAQPR